MKFKYFNISLLIAIIAITTSCDKDIPVNGGTPNLEVTTAATTYKVNEPITFNFTGDAGIISFYSGEPLRDYEYKNGRAVELTSQKLSFQTFATSGTQGILNATIPPHLSVMASIDFNGNYDFASVKAATWTDITNRFTYYTTGTAFITSGTKDISDLVVAGKPLYIAFKYVTKPQVANGTVRQWQIQNFLVSGSAADIPTAVTVLDHTSSGFRLIDQNPTTAPAQSSVTNARITLWGNKYETQEPNNDPQSENWAVSRPIYSQKANLGPDLAIHVKEYVAKRLEKYVYTYKTPGTYKACFVGSNVNIHDNLSVAKSINITIVP